MHGSDPDCAKRGNARLVLLASGACQGNLRDQIPHRVLQSRPERPPWYDVVALPSGGIGLVIGDVEGHSIESCVVMGQMRSAVLVSSLNPLPATTVETPES